MIIYDDIYIYNDIYIYIYNDIWWYMMIPLKPLSLAINVHQPQRNWMPFPRPSWLLSRSAPNGGSSWIYHDIYLEFASVEFKVSFFFGNMCPLYGFGMFFGRTKTTTFDRSWSTFQTSFVGWIPSSYWSHKSMGDLQDPTDGGTLVFFWPYELWEYSLKFRPEK